MNSRWSRAATFCSSWATLLAPISTEVTRGSRKAQAMAICARDWPRPWAMSLRARMRARLSSLSMSRRERAVRRGPGAGGDTVEVSVGEETLRQDGEGDAPDAFGVEDVEEAVFDPAVEHRVRRLVDEQRGAEPAEDGDGLGGALVGVRGDADVEGLAGGDGGVEGAEGLLEGGLGVEVVVVEDVDVVEPEAPQALIEAGEEVLPGAEVAVGARPHVPTGLGGDDELVAVVAEVLVEDPGEVGLGAAVGGPVVVGQVEMGDAQVEGSAHDGPLGVDGPVVAEVLPQPERHGGQEQAAAPTTAIGHGPVAILGGKVAGHVSAAPSRCWHQS